MLDLVREIGNVDLEITFDCNLRCLHCYNETHDVCDELTTLELFRILGEINDAGFKEVHITGGEPLKHREVVGILSYCNVLGLDTLLETNGVLIDDAIIPQLRQLPGLKVRASIDGPEAIHNKIRRGGDINAYRTAVSNLVQIQEAGVPVQVTSSVNGLNYSHIGEMIRDLSAEGIKDIRLRLSMPASAGYIHWQILKLNAAKLEELKGSLGQLKLPDSVNLDVSSLNRRAPKLGRKMFITPHGNVKPYPFIESYVGNIRTSSLGEILGNYDSVSYPKEQEDFMTEYLSELGMVQDEI